MERGRPEGSPLPVDVVRGQQSLEGRIGGATQRVPQVVAGAVKGAVPMYEMEDTLFTSSTKVCGVLVVDIISAALPVLPVGIAAELLHLFRIADVHDGPLL